MNAASRRLIDFIRTAPHDAQGLYTFQIKGTATDAQKFVHRMRVELSRIRGYFKRKRGQQVKAFKMLVISMEENKTAGTTVIQLQYVESISQRFLKDVNEIFELVGTDNKVIDERAARGLKVSFPKTDNVTSGGLPRVKIG